MLSVNDIMIAAEKMIMKRMDQTVFQKLEQFLDSTKEMSFDFTFSSIKKTIAKRTTKDFQGILEYLKAGSRKSGINAQRWLLQVQEEHIQNVDKYLQNCRLTFGRGRYERKSNPKKGEQPKAQTPAPIDSQGQNRSVARSRRSSASQRSIKSMVRKKSCQRVRKLSKQWRKDSKEYSSDYSQQESMPKVSPKQENKQNNPSIKFRPIQYGQFQPKQAPQQRQEVVIPQLQKQQVRSQADQEVEVEQDIQTQQEPAAEPIQKTAIQQNQITQQTPQQLTIQEPKQIAQSQLGTQGKEEKKEEEKDEKEEEVRSEHSIENDNALSVAERTNRLDNLYRRSQKMRDKFIKLSPMILSPSIQTHHFDSQRLNKSEIITSEWQQQQLSSSYQSQRLPNQNSAFSKAKEQQAEKTATSSIKESQNYPLPYNVELPSHYKSQAVQHKDKQV